MWRTAITFQYDRRVTPRTTKTEATAQGERSNGATFDVQVLLDRIEQGAGRAEALRRRVEELELQLQLESERRREVEEALEQAHKDTMALQQQFEAFAMYETAETGGLGRFLRRPQRHH